ncbi:glutathione S-transferase C-terminal domain-containing protein [Kineothrix sedimenti]|uniref:Glutathione S-transferase C-terminal domain-containing protein n=1 Tax=Kineothrix sedimenti TaxID=3123317 RepID=A0ABZ3F1V8_9FIRM
MDWLEEKLSYSRYLFGDRITESDVRLYVTLARFDVAYYNGFWTNRNKLTDFEVIKKHYHLCAVATNPCGIVAKGCHWLNRASIVRELLGLEDAIGINLVGHSKENRSYGWEFVYNEDRKDPVLGMQYLSEFYYNADPDYAGRCTVPALVDVTTKKVVNNDYRRLTNYFETAFVPYQKEGAPDLYPEELRKEIDDFNDWLFPNVNNGTYRMMFAQSITAYQEAFEDFYNAPDTIEERLSRNRFLLGDYVTDSDVRLFVTLARSPLIITEI